ncbi:MAG: NUDIX domain-containing protein [Phycisphaerales bacterium]
MPSAIAAVAMTRCAADGGRQWLVAQRLPGARLGGFWEWPGGKVEPGESSSAAAARELEEEVGVPIDAASLQPVAPPLDAGAITLELFWVDAPADAMPSAIGCAQVRWVAADELATLPFPPANAPLTHAVIALDRSLATSPPPSARRDRRDPAA